MLEVCIPANFLVECLGLLHDCILNAIKKQTFLKDSYRMEVIYSHPCMGPGRNYVNKVSQIEEKGKKLKKTSAKLAITIAVRSYLSI